MGASDRFLFPGGTPGGPSRVLVDSTQGRHPMRPAETPRSSAVLQRCQGPIQLSLFAGFDALPRSDEDETTDLPTLTLTIERRNGGRRSTD